MDSKTCSCQVKASPFIAGLACWSCCRLWRHSTPSDDRRSGTPLTAKFMRPTWGPRGAGRTHVGPMLATWTLLSGDCYICVMSKVLRKTSANISLSNLWWFHLKISHGLQMIISLHRPVHTSSWTIVRHLSINQISPSVIGPLFGLKYPMTLYSEQSKIIFWLIIYEWDFAKFENWFQMGFQFCNNLCVTGRCVTKNELI